MKQRERTGSEHVESRRISQPLGGLTHATRAAFSRSAPRAERLRCTHCFRADTRRSGTECKRSKLPCCSKLNKARFSPSSSFTASPFLSSPFPFSRCLFERLRECRISLVEGWCRSFLIFDRRAQ